MGRPRGPRQVEREFWRLIVAGEQTAAAAGAVGVSEGAGLRWFVQGGGMPPMGLGQPSGRYLSLVEREEIAIGTEKGEGVRAIARRLGRHPSTVSREVARNSPVSARADSAEQRREGRARDAARNAGRWRREGLHRGWGGRGRRPGGYRAVPAQAKADARARRPKVGKLAANQRLREYVQGKLSGPQRWSPEQIAARIGVDRWGQIGRAHV